MKPWKQPHSSDTKAWSRWNHKWAHGRAKPDWHHKRRSLFFRLIGVFGFIALPIVGGMAILAFLLTRLFGGNTQTALLVWVGGCSLALALPLLAVGLAAQAFRRIATPLANVMAAADAVAEGDFSVRVPEYGPSEFARLGHSFNRMTAELERADQQRRNLTADVAHELRTPLHIIQGNLEGILDGIYEATPEHITATLDETRLLARLVEDLKTLSLAEAGQLPLKKETIMVTELLADINTSFSGQAEAAAIDLQIKTNNISATSTLTADIGRLNQVLGNLLINALRHTPGGGRIILGAEATASGIQLRVQDTGEGIPAEDLPYIFDRFWRGDRSRSHGGGTGGGLGLAIAKQLIQTHGGKIYAESAPTQGTTFTIELPHVS